MIKKSRVAIATLAVTGAVSIITQFEGFSEKAYIPIKDDKVTIGYGQTFYANGRSVRIGDRITQARALTELEALVGRDFLARLAACITVPLTQNEFDAYMSLAYNIGTAAFCKSTLVKKLNAGNYAAACSEILRWKYAKGRVVKGLENRRFKEYQLCMA